MTATVIDTTALETLESLTLEARHNEDAFGPLVDLLMDLGCSDPRPHGEKDGSTAARECIEAGDTPNPDVRNFDGSLVSAISGEDLFDLITGRSPAVIEDQDEGFLEEIEPIVRGAWLACYERSAYLAWRKVVEASQAPIRERLTVYRNGIVCEATNLVDGVHAEDYTSSTVETVLEAIKDGEENITVGDSVYTWELSQVG